MKQIVWIVVTVLLSPSARGQTIGRWLELNDEQHWIQRSMADKLAALQHKAELDQEGRNYKYCDGTIVMQGGRRQSCLNCRAYSPTKEDFVYEYPVTCSAGDARRYQ